MYARLRKVIANGAGLVFRSHLEARTTPEAALIAERVSQPRSSRVIVEDRAEFLASLTKTWRNLHSSEHVRQSGPREIKEAPFPSPSLCLPSSCSRHAYREGTERKREEIRWSHRCAAASEPHGTRPWKEAPFRLRFGSVVRDINGPMPPRERKYPANQCWQALRPYCKESGRV